MTTRAEVYEVYNAAISAINGLAEEERPLVLHWLIAPALEAYLSLLTASRSPRPPADEIHPDYNRYVFLRGWNEGLDQAAKCLGRVPALATPPKESTDG